MFDPTGDFEAVVDGPDRGGRLENVTLEVYGESNKVSLNAHRNQVTNQEVEASNGLVKQGDTAWMWPISELSSQPALGSVIIDRSTPAGERWTILRLDKRVMNSVWRAVCRNLAVEARLDTLVTIQQATYSKGAGGAAEASWADVYTSVRARVQPISVEPEIEHDADEVERLYRIILEDDLVITLGADYRVIDSDLNIYAVRRYERPERIDTLPALDVEWIGTTSSSSSSGS